MTKKSNYALMALKAASWVIFVGVCVEAGAFLSYMVLSLSLNPEDFDKLWKEVDLTVLYNYNESYFVTLSSLMVIAAVLRAVLFYIIICIFYDKTLDISQPFTEIGRKFMVKIAYLALGIGLFSYWGMKFSQNLVSLGLDMPDVQDLGLGGADVWFFMGVILLVCSQVFKKAVEMKNENDLTI